jgi:catechol 2,3-dioxygenase-like lactoylglutathione lyase family enzyme
MSITSTSDIIIQTDRFDQARSFYQDVLGFELFEDDGQQLGFDTGNFRLFVERGSTPGPVFDFEVADLDETKRRLIAQGCVVQEEDEALPRLYLRDPFGLVFNIAEHSPARSLP